MAAAQPWIALLRGVNVGGRNAVPMAELRDLAEACGFAKPRTLLQSGNLVFTARAARAACEDRLEHAIAERFGVRIVVVARDLAAWTHAIDANPFAREARDDPSHVLVTCAKTTPAAGAQARLEAAILGRERAQLRGDVAYVVYPDGIGTSKLTPQKIEKALGTPVTARNWNTVCKLRELAAAP